ncbi:MAG: ATP-binding cassette domain-containing protein, partial [Bacteroidota bacterium]
SVKNDYVREFLSTQINSELVAEYYALYQASLEDGAMEGDKKRKAQAEQQEGRARRTSVTDSARIMKFCKKINKTLQQQQKVIVYVRLLEFIKSDNSFTPLREEIIETVARVFRMPREEIGSIERFTKMEHVAEADLDKDILVIGDLPDLEGASHLYIRNTSISGAISVLRVPSANLFFLRYDSRTTMHLNNKPVQANRVYLFPPGGVLRPGHSRSIYYSDINAAFLSDQMDLSLDFVAEGISHTFRNGHVGLHPLSIHETNGRLIGIMGASGAGKTTLLNLLSGQQAPTTGTITINGLDLYRDRKQLEGAIGLVPQDDLLFEDLTVFENLFYNARLSFRDLSR